jgi:hypothetical protein
MNLKEVKEKSCFLAKILFFLWSRVRWSKAWRADGVARSREPGILRLQARKVHKIRTKGWVLFKGQDIQREF